MKTAEKAYRETVELLKGYESGDLHGGSPMQHIKAYAKQVAEQALKDASENVAINIGFAGMRLRVQRTIIATQIQLP